MFKKAWSSSREENFSLMECGEHSYIMDNLWSQKVSQQKNTKQINGNDFQVAKPKPLQMPSHSFLSQSLLQLTALTLYKQKEAILTSAFRCQKMAYFLLPSAARFLLTRKSLLSLLFQKWKTFNFHSFFVVFYSRRMGVHGCWAYWVSWRRKLAVGCCQ